MQEVWIRRLGPGKEAGLGCVPKHGASPTQLTRVCQYGRDIKIGIMASHPLEEKGNKILSV